MNLPKISVITPSYNQGEFIERTVQSVLMQNYPNVEHIIVDGGSTDDTVKILKKYLHLKWVSEADKGQSDAFNKGLNIATGDIIGWLNSDDVYLENTLHTVVAAFKNNPTTDVVYGDCYYISEDDRILRRFVSKKFSLHQLLTSCYCFIHPMSTFIKKNVFDALEYSLDLNLHYCMDHDLFIRIYKNGFKFKYVPIFLSSFRRSSTNKTTVWIKEMRRESFLICKKYEGNSFVLYVNYLISKIYLLFPPLTNFIRNVRYKLSLQWS